MEHLIDKMNREHFNNELIIGKPYFDGPFAMDWKIGFDNWKTGKLTWSPIAPESIEITEDTVEQLRPKLEKWLIETKKTRLEQ